MMGQSYSCQWAWKKFHWDHILDRRMVSCNLVLQAKEMLSVLVEVWARKKVSKTTSLRFCAELEKEKSWDHTEFGSKLQKERDQTHRHIVCFFQCFSSYYQDVFFTFLRQGLWIHASKLPGEQFSCLECGIHTAPCEGRSSLVVWTGYFCPCPLFLVGNVLYVYLRIFNVSFAKEQQPLLWCLGMLIPLSEGSGRIKQVFSSQKWRRKAVVKQ